MPILNDVAPIIWAKWGEVFLETLRQEAASAADQTAFRAMNSAAGTRTLLAICTTDRSQIQAAEKTFSLGVVKRPVDWQKYSLAEMTFKTEKGSGLSHQAQGDAPGTGAMVLCATRPSFVRALERLFDLPE